VDHFQWQRFKI